jgi:hypothetical protein
MIFSVQRASGVCRGGGFAPVYCLSVLLLADNHTLSCSGSGGVQGGRFCGRTFVHKGLVYSLILDRFFGEALEDRRDREVFRGYELVGLRV